MSANPCMVCDTSPEQDRLYCPLCGGLTQFGAKSLAPYEPQRLLVRWESGTLYLGKLSLEDDIPLEPDQKPDPTYVWIFLYDEDITYSPGFARIQQDDRRLGQIPHPNLPSQIDRGFLGRRAYVIFDGYELALPLPSWRPNLPEHVRIAIFSRLAEIVTLLQSANILRPVIDPYRVMVFWDEEKDLLDFRWLPLPELGNYLYREGFKPTTPQTQPLKAAPVTPHPSTHHGHFLDAEDTPPPETLRHGAAHLHETPMFPASAEDAFDPLSVPGDVTGELPSFEELHKAKKQRSHLMQTDEFELMAVLERIGDSDEDLESIARRLAALEVATRIPPTETGEQTNPLTSAVDPHDTIPPEFAIPAPDLSSPSAQLSSHALSQRTLEPTPPPLSRSSIPELEHLDLSSEEHTLAPILIPPPQSRPVVPPQESAPAKAHEDAPQKTDEEHLQGRHPEFSETSPIQGEEDDDDDCTSDGVIKVPTLEPSHALGDFAFPPPESPQSPEPSKKSTLAHVESREHSLDPLEEPLDVVRGRPLEEASAALLEHDPDEITDSTGRNQTNALAQLFQTQVNIQYNRRIGLGQIFPIQLTFRPPSIAAAPATIEIVPVFPGCLSSPERTYIQLHKEPIQATFWLTPFAQGALQQSAEIQFWHQHKQCAHIPLPIRVYNQNLVYSFVIATVLLMAFGLASPTVLPPSTPAFVSSLLQTIHPWTWPASLLCLFAALFCFLLRKPERHITECRGQDLVPPHSPT